MHQNSAGLRNPEILIPDPTKLSEYYLWQGRLLFQMFHAKLHTMENGCRSHSLSPRPLLCRSTLSRFMIYTDLFIRFSIFFEIVDKIENWGGNYFFQHLDRAASNCHFRVRRSLLTAARTETLTGAKLKLSMIDLCQKWILLKFKLNPNLGLTQTISSLQGEI